MDLNGTQSADTLIGGAADDVIYGFGGNDRLRGGAGDDVLAGHEGNDILQGGDGDDYLLGGPGNDTLDGGAGSDWAAYEDATAGVKVDLNLTGAQNTGGGGTDRLTSIENLYGSAFNDTLVGNAGDNVLMGWDGNDIISGGKGEDTLWGSAGNDTLDGGDNDDWLVGGAGDDVIKGGAGADWSSYEDATAGVTVDLTKTTAQDTIGAGKDTLSGIESVWGSKFADVLTGDAGSNYLFGDAGDDKLYGGAGDDFFAGGAGANVIDGGEGWDTVDYAMSAVGVEVDLSRNIATSIGDASISDRLSSIELVTGSTHDDYLIGSMSENYLFGDAGNDVLWAEGGYDTMDGGEGNDILRGSFRKPGDMLLGGAGRDQIIVWTGVGSEGAATIVDGGTGIDDLIFSSLVDITLDLSKTGDQVIAPGVHMVVSNIENVTGGYGNDRLTGDAGDNIINGGGGDDVLDGGAGFDIVSYAGDRTVRVDLSKTGAQDTRGQGVDTLSNFEGIRGSLKADILIGDAKDNTVEGGLGDDIMDGGAGADTGIFFGNANQYTWNRNANGTWTVKGLEGTDTLLNIETLKFNDKSVTLSPSATTVTVDDLVGVAAPSSIMTVVGRVILGTDGDDELLSDGGTNIFVGGKGADTLVGGEGFDIFMFAAGDTTWSTESDAGVDVIANWGRDDRLSFTFGMGGYREDTASSWNEALERFVSSLVPQGGSISSFQVGSDVYVFGSSGEDVNRAIKIENITLEDLSIENFSWVGNSQYAATGIAITGDEKGDVLQGIFGYDVIRGEGGDDTIDGGWSLDILIGGDGADTFKFQAGDGAFNIGLTVADVITDFGSGDKLAFAGAPAVVKEIDILRLPDVGSVNSSTGAISAAAQLAIQSFHNQIQTGATTQKYLIVGAGDDTYVVADTDNVLGYDQVVLLKNVASSLVTADMFTGV